MFIVSWLERLAAGVFVMAFLVIGGWLLQAFGVPPSAVADFVAGKILYDIAVLGPLLPYLAALVGMAGLVFILAHHREFAVLSGISTLLLSVAAFAWHLGIGAWVATHLAAVT
jgi:hypothetical protein